MGLGDIRRRIDRIDERILGLLGRRMRLALRTPACKGRLRDPSRERTVLRRVRAAAARSGLAPGWAAGLYRGIMKETLRRQRAAGKRGS